MQSAFNLSVLIRNIARIAALMFALSAVSLLAVPYVPDSDLATLERLPGRPIDAARPEPSARAARGLLARDPKNLDLAVRIAQLYVSRSRSESDPRLLGQAEAALRPWWSQPDPPVPVLLLRATIRQSNHDFTSARRDLEQIVRREPTNAQAWLTLATVQQVTGDLAAASDSCHRLTSITPELVSVTCKASVDGLRGLASQSYDALATVTLSSPSTRTPVGVRTWALTLQAELAERLSRMDDAERHYRASLALDPRDGYTLAAYADFLMDAGRAAEVLTLIPADTRADILLLRRAIAANVMATPEAKKISEDLGQRFAASRARGDRVHLREEARYALLIKRSASEALTLALENWAVQKEPLDARVALEAAIAARQPKAVAKVVTWIDDNKLQGSALLQLSGRLKAL